MSRKQSKGVSLAKGPIGILGVAAVVYGVLSLIFAGHGFALHVPHGSVYGAHSLGLLVNGWSELLFIAAGLALLLFAPTHWGAKTMAWFVGLVLIAAAVVAVIRGNGVFGIFAANHITELVWGIGGLVLLVLGLLPRVGGRRGEPAPDRGRPVGRRRRVVEPQPAPGSERITSTQHTAGEEGIVGPEDTAGAQRALGPEDTGGRYTTEAAPAPADDRRLAGARSVHANDDTQE